MIGLSLVAVLLRPTVAAPQPPQAAPGVVDGAESAARAVDRSGVERWWGVIRTPVQHLRCELRFWSDEDDVQRGEMISWDQQRARLPISTLARTDQGWELQLAPVGASYTGRVTESGSVLGLWSQGNDQWVVVWYPADEYREPELEQVWIGQLPALAGGLELQFRLPISDPISEPISGAEATTESLSGGLAELSEEAGLEASVASDAARSVTDQLPRLAYMDSLDEGFTSIVARWTSEADRVTIRVPAVGASFIGRLRPDGQQLAGTFTQNLIPLPLRLSRAEASDPRAALAGTAADRSSASDRVPSQEPVADRPASGGAAAVRRPQEPRLPLAYPTSEFVIPVRQPGTAAFELAGTLSLPVGPGPHPALVLVTGSGAQDRDESVAGHRPFAVLADYLAGCGVATARFDDRGTAASGGDFAAATTDDFAIDAEAVWSWLRTQPDIDPARVGLLGHSEGAWVAIQVAAWNPEVPWLVLMGPPGLPGAHIIESQADAIADRQGEAGPSRRAMAELRRELHRLALPMVDNETWQQQGRQAVEVFARQIRLGTEPLVAEPLVAEPRDESTPMGEPPADASDSEAAADRLLVEGVWRQFQALRTPWMQRFLEYDPEANLMLVDAEVLAVWGERDLQVLPELNRAMYETAALRNPQLRLESHVLPGLNHLLQPCSDGLPRRYSQIETTLDPALLDLICSWLARRCGAP
jgi:uncharacterized protein